MSNAQFKRDFAKLMKKAGDNMEALVRASAMELLKRVILKSPVGDPSMWKDPTRVPPGYVGGRFKANWQVSVGVIDFNAAAAPDMTGMSSLKRGAGAIGSFPLGTQVFITNSLPYSRRIEYNAWSKQAQAGVVRITAMEFKNIVRQLAKNLK